MLKTTLEQWRMFKAVVEHGGFNQAALVVHKTQSTVHHAVSKLEETLGFCLLEAKGRKVFPTKAGKLMLHRANYVLDEAIKLETVAESLNNCIETHLKIAIDAIFPQELLFCVLKSIAEKFPLLRIELIETILSGADELLDQSAVSVAISSYPLNTFSEEVCKVEMLAVANPEHSLHQLKHPLSKEDLMSHRQIVVRDSALQLSKDEGWLHAEQRWTVSHMHTSIDLVCKNHGFAWLPKPNIQKQLQEGMLLPLNLIQGKSRSVSMYLNIADIDLLEPAAKIFVHEMLLSKQ